MTKMLIGLLVLVALISPVMPAAQAQDDVSGDGWSIEGDIPDEVVPLKFANGEADVDSCDIEGGCWILAEAGVLGADRWEDAQANPSAVWTGGGDAQELLENRTADLILPESGYITASGAGFDVTCDGYSLRLEASPDHMWYLLLRGRTDGSGDRNVVCHFSNYTAGAVLVTMYAVPVEASAFFSQDYFTDNVENAHVRKNCGATGCADASTLEFDINDAAYAVQTHDDDGFDLVETNTVNE